MRSTVLMLAAGLALAGCSMMPTFVGGGEKPTAEVAPPANSAELSAQPAKATEPAVAPAHAYEIRHLVRGPVRRVKVLLNGRTIETLTMSRGRTEATSHCCTADGCEMIPVPKKNEPVKSCASFIMLCDAKGACKEDAPPKASSKI
jgi:hypothetical protein